MARMIGAKAGVAAVLALLASSSSAFTAPASALAMQTGGITSQPIGHYEFCQANASECRAGVRGQAPAKVTAYGWTVVREINAGTNNAITPMTDKDLYGKELKTSEESATAAWVKAFAANAPIINSHARLGIK